MCADTITANYHWVKPEISGSPTTWGVKLNADLDLIDSQLFTTDANATQAVHDSMQVGMIVMFGGATPPDNWKLCDGTVYNNTDIPLLAPILNNAFGGSIGTSNAVPDMRIAFPVGTGTITGGYFGDPSATMSLGETGGEPWHTLVSAEIPSHTHPVTDPQHQHDVDYMFGGGGTTGPFTAGTDGNLYTTATELASTGITVNANTGGDSSHNNMPPYIGLNFIIKFAMSTPFRPIEIPPGVVATATKKMRSSNWAEVNLCRWVEGQLAPSAARRNMHTLLRLPLPRYSRLVRARWHSLYCIFCETERLRRHWRRPG